MVAVGRPGAVAVTVSVSRSCNGGVEDGPQCFPPRSAAHVDDREQQPCKRTAPDRVISRTRASPSPA